MYYFKITTDPVSIIKLNCWAGIPSDAVTEYKTFVNDTVVVYSSGLSDNRKDDDLDERFVCLCNGKVM